MEKENLSRTTLNYGFLDRLLLVKNVLKMLRLTFSFGFLELLFGCHEHIKSQKVLKISFLIQFYCRLSLSLMKKGLKVHFLKLSIFPKSRRCMHHILKYQYQPRPHKNFLPTYHFICFAQTFSFHPLLSQISHTYPSPSQWRFIAEKGHSKINCHYEQNTQPKEAKTHRLCVLKKGESRNGWYQSEGIRIIIQISSFLKKYSTTMKEENECEERIGQYTGPEDLDGEGQKLFLPKCLSKKVPIGNQFHQTQVPQLITLQEFQQNSDQIVHMLKSPLSCQTFKMSNISSEEVQEYLEFVQEYYLQKDPDIFTQGTLSKEKIFPKALELLHNCKYNVIRAKFSITFPYYITFNRLRPESAIKLTDQQMVTKMRKHKEGLRRTREKDQQKWSQEILQRIQQRVDLHALVSLIQSGKQNKYDLPENVKQLIDRATKFGKQLKKMTSQSNKIYIQRLLQKKDQLSNQKIITNQMNIFQSTVIRCIQWTRKASDFSQAYFILVMTPDGPMKKLKKTKQKIQFKFLSNLVQEYNSLPLLNDDFQEVKFLYDQTIELLDKLPQFAKSVKTRNQNIARISIQALRGLQTVIEHHPVKCDQFDFFSYQIEENLEFIQRISMMLEDERTQKTAKLLASYLKQANDIPIQSNIVQRLENYIEYMGLIQKIRKDILVFSKFQQTQQNIKLAYEKGFASSELADYQSKLDVYKNWFHTTQKFQISIEYNKIDIVKKQTQIISNMIDEQVFRIQLLRAKQDLKIEEEEILSYYQKLQFIQEQKKSVIKLLEQKYPNLQELSTQTLDCIKQGLKYKQFLQLFVLTRRLLLDVADLSFLLNQHGFIEEEDLPKMFFTIDEHQEIVSFKPGHKKQLKELTKTQMQMMLQQTTIKAFPNGCVEWQMFKQFIQSCSENQQKAAKLISTYNRLQTFEGHSQALYHQIQELLKELKGMLVSDSIIRQLNEIMQILKCRRIIDTKICLQLKDVFTPSNVEFIQKIREKLNVVKQFVPAQNLKSKSLRFQSEYKTQMAEVLTKISAVNFQKPLKLSEINRIQKEIEKIQLESLQLRTMKKELHNRYQKCEDWRSSMLQIKNIKKPKKDEKQKQKQKEKPKDISSPKKQQEGVVQMQVQQQGIKEQYNNSFYFYFKFPLLLIKFYEGLKLKTNLEELSRLRTFIFDIGGFINKYDVLEKNPKPQAVEIGDLNLEGNKHGAVFLLEKWKISRRNQYVMQWRNMAISILESMPILRLQQRIILLIPDIPANNYKETIPNQQIIQEEHQHQAEVVRKQNNQTQIQPSEGKRKRRLNPFYNNEQITLFVEDLLPLKPKKKKKPEQPPRRKTQSKRSKKQQIVEYAEPLESVYCICRLGLMNESSIMLQCQICQRWFHTECVGIRRSYIKSLTSYFCPGCCKRYQISPDYFKSFYWQSNRKMSEQNFRFLVNQGHEMNVILQQLSVLLTLEGRIDMWKVEVQKTVRAVLEAEAKGRINDNNAEMSLFNLYIESLWLPTIHVETDVLLTLLKKHDSPQKLAQIRRKHLS